MRRFVLPAALAGAIAGALALGFAGTSQAAPAMPNLSLLPAAEANVGGVEQARWWHRRCHWVRQCNRWGRCYWVRRCHRGW
jgi:hypothetical protein